jgi:hypothetical protein
MPAGGSAGSASLNLTTDIPNSTTRHGAGVYIVGAAGNK